MATNPNNAFKDLEFKGHDGMMMTEGQRTVIEARCKEHNISLIALTTRVFGYRKKTRDLTHVDAARCILMAGVWENYRKAGDEQ